MDIFVVLVVREFLYLFVIVDFLYVVGKWEMIEFLLLVLFVVEVDGIIVEVYYDLENVLFDGV